MSIWFIDFKGDNIYYCDFVKDYNGYGRCLNLDNLFVGKYMLIVK